MLIASTIKSEGVLNSIKLATKVLFDTVVNLYILSVETILSNSVQLLNKYPILDIASTVNSTFLFSNPPPLTEPNWGLFTCVKIIAPFTILYVLHGFLL